MRAAHHTRKWLSTEAAGKILIGLVLISILMSGAHRLADVKIPTSIQQWSISMPDTPADNPERVSLFDIFAGITAVSTLWEFRIFPICSTAEPLTTGGSILREHRWRPDRPPKPAAA